jgi:hypothetical protein
VVGLFQQPRRALAAVAHRAPAPLVAALLVLVSS